MSFLSAFGGISFAAGGIQAIGNSFMPGGAASHLIQNDLALGGLSFMNPNQLIMNADGTIVMGGGATSPGMAQQVSP